MSSEAAKEPHSSSDEESSLDGDGPIEPTSGGPSAASVAPAGSIDSSRKGRFDISNIDQHKRQKRLAMNRESARTRRRQKKIRLETLEQRAENLSREHDELTSTNEGLKARVSELESELERKRSGRAAGIGDLGGSAAAGTGVIGGSGATVSPPGRDPAAASLVLTSEQRAALALRQQPTLSHLESRGINVGLPSQQSSFENRGVTFLSGPEMQLLQIQQLMSRQGRESQSSRGGGTSGSGGSGIEATGGGGTNIFSAARLTAMQDFQARLQMAGMNPLSALIMGSGPGGVEGHQLGGELGRLSNIPDLRRLDELRRMRTGAPEGLGNPPMLNLAPAPNEDTTRRLAQLSASDNPRETAGLGGQQHESSAGSRRERDIRSDLYDKLAGTNKRSKGGR